MPALAHLCQAVISCCLEPQCPAAAAAAHTKSQYYPGTFITDITPHCPAWLPSQWPAHPHHGTIVIIGNRNKEHSVNILIRVASVKVGSMSFPPRIQSEKCYVGSRSVVACCQKKSETVMVGDEYSTQLLSQGLVEIYGQTSLITTSVNYKPCKSVMQCKCNLAELFDLVEPGFCLFRSKIQPPPT